MIRPEGDIETVPSTPYKFTAMTIKVGGAPETTTEAPKDTTAAPKDTTAAPKDTTEAPKDTTAAPKDTTEPEGNVVWGDTTLDGDVTIGDVVMLNKHLAGGTKLNAQALKNADVNHNNQPDTQDAVKIKAYLAELISKADLAAAGNYKAK